MIFVCPGPLWPGPRAAVAKVRAPAAASTRPRARPVVLRPGVDWRSRRCPWIVSTTMALGLTVSIHDTKTAFRPTRRLIAAAARDWSRLLSMPHNNLVRDHRWLTLTPAPPPPRPRAPAPAPASARPRRAPSRPRGGLMRHLSPLPPLLLLRLRLRLRSTTRRWRGTSWTYRMAATRPDAAAAARATPGGHTESAPQLEPPEPEANARAELDSVAAVQKTRAGGPRRPWAAPSGSSRPRRSSGSAWA